MKLHTRPITALQRLCVIQATIGPLIPFRVGIARNRQGPFFKPHTVQGLVNRGYLRGYRCGRHFYFTARSA